MFIRLTIASILLLGAASIPAAAQTPRPGTLETYRDWTIGCDNVSRCEAVALLPENGEMPDVALTMGVSRVASIDATPEFWVERDAQDAGSYAFHVDGRRIATAPATNGAAMVRGPQASALVVEMARGRTMEIRFGGKVVARPSLAGSGAALRYMDAAQGRAGTVTALVATGPIAAHAMRRPPVAPVVRRAIAPSGAAPAALTREELAIVGRITDCAQEMKQSDSKPSLHRVSRTETLVLVPCGSGAYNFSSMALIATGAAGHRNFRMASFDYPPGWSESPDQPLLVNAAWTPEHSRLESFAKGRGLGDCGGSEAYVWDGMRFRLVGARAMGECRGAWHWIPTWTAKVVE